MGERRSEALYAPQHVLDHLYVREVDCFLDRDDQHPLRLASANHISTFEEFHKL
jgi:hypothetical protein